MVNDPELNGKQLGRYSADFARVSDLLKEACYQLRARQISLFPIVVVAAQQTALGAWLYGPQQPAELDLTFFYHLSLLEEFEQRDLVQDREAFMAAWKDPDEFCCLFVVEPDFTNFLFIPWPEE